MRIELPELPYPLDALEPFISARTLQIHHRTREVVSITTNTPVAEIVNIAFCEQLLN